MATRGDEENTVTSSESTKFKFSNQTSLEDLRAMVEKFAEERDWDQYHTPRNLLLAMVGEVGELSEIFQWRGEVKEGLKDWSEDDKVHLGQELSDVLIYLIRLAHKCHIDLPIAAVEKMALNERKYPAKQVRGSSKKYSEYNTDVPHGSNGSLGNILDPENNHVEEHS